MDKGFQARRAAWKNHRWLKALYSRRDLLLLSAGLFIDKLAAVSLVSGSCNSIGLASDDGMVAGLLVYGSRF